MTAPSPAGPSALPRRVRLLIGAAVAATAGSLAAICVEWHQLAAMTAHQWAVMAAITVLATAGSVRPLLLYRGVESEAFVFSEAFLVLMLLTLPPVSALTGILLVSAATQVIRRRPPSKGVFNVGQMCAAAAAAIALARWISPAPGHFQIGTVGAATVGAAAFFVINITAVAAVLTALGSTWRSCLLDGIRLRLALSASGVVAGAVLGVALRSGTWVLIPVGATLVLVRHTVGAQFKAEHDRARARGLLDATLDAYRTLDGRAVTDGILETARTLLRSPQSHFSLVAPDSDVAAVMTSNGTSQWLVAAGRRKDEPFEDTDVDLVRALAAVGSGAATNAELYRQVRYERERLASVALSIGEGVVAVDPDGRLTFANAAADEIVALPPVPAVGEEPGGSSERAPDFLIEPALRCMRTGQTVRDDHALFPSKDGGTVPVAYIASPIMERNNRAAGVVIAFHDVTERRVLEEKLRHEGL
ncbi:MAG TPA: PAS domain-containing protein, partial [Acidimicrobiales bacterium]|nr:PAS domain-containing protein [Acidimicrobiales bacterium]